MITIRFLVLLVLGFCMSGCGSSNHRVTVPDTSLRDDAGTLHALRPRHDQKLTVLIFYSPHCPMLRAHDERVRALAKTYSTRKVSFFAVYSEVGDGEISQAESTRYPFPIVRDENAKLARQLGAQYSGYTVIVGPTGELLFRGGIDSDRVELHAEAEHYLKNALDDLLSGRSPRNAATKSYGCVLRLS